MSTLGPVPTADITIKGVLKPPWQSWFYQLYTVLTDLTLTGPVPSSRQILTTSPLAGGGNLTADRTLSINANGISNVFLAQMPANTIKGNNTAGLANASDLSIAQVNAMLGTTVGASPTASIGLSVVNGAATTFMRSDAAPPLSQAIAPTWSAQHTFTLAPIFSAPLLATSGGTGFASYTQGDLLYASSGTALSRLADVAAGSFLRSGGIGGNPTWSTITVPDAAVLGDTWYGSAASTISALAGNTTTTKKFLSQTGTGAVSAAPSWATIASSDLPGSFSGFANPSATLGLTAVNGSATTAMRSDAAPALSEAIVPTWSAQHTFTLAPIFSAPLLATSGGTGFASYTQGDLLYASSGTALSKLVGVAAGSYLRSGGVGANPVWSTVTVPNTATQGDLWYASAANVLSALADVAAGSFLRSGGVSTAPAWSAITVPNAAVLGDIWYSSAASTLIALAGNTTATKKFLTQTGTGAVSAAPGWNTIVAGDLPGSFSGFANPSANVGLSVVNGAATTAMRSDAAPALSQSIVPTWTGLHTFQNNLGSFSATGNPILVIVNTNANAQSPIDFFSNTSTLTGRIRNDFAANMNFVALLSGSHVFWVGGDSGVGTQALNLASGALAFGNTTNNPTFTFLGTATPKHGGTQLIQTSAALTNNAGALVGTLTNSPTTGNPTKWIPINDNGTVRNIPAW